MKGNPFFLDEEGENWVLDTWKNMSLEQKCGQVFCPMGFNGVLHLTKSFRYLSIPLVHQSSCILYRRHQIKHNIALVRMYFYLYLIFFVSVSIVVTVH